MSSSSRIKGGDGGGTSPPGSRAKKRAAKQGPGPTLPRLAGTIFWVTLDCLVPASLLVSQHGNSLGAFLDAELVSFDSRTGGLDLCLLAIVRSVVSTAIGFAFGKWCPLALGIQALAMFLGVVKMAAVPAEWWASGYHIALSACYVCFGLFQMHLSWRMRKVKLDILPNDLNDLSKVEEGGAAATRSNVRSDSSSIERLLQLAKPEKTILFFGTVALVIANIAVMVIPALFGQLINLISIKDKDEGTAALGGTVGWLVLFICIMSLFTAIRGWLYTLAGERLVARFRKQLFAKIAHHDISFFDTVQSGEIVNRLASDTNVVQNAVTVNISMALRFFGQGVIGMIIIFMISPKLTGMMLAVVPVIMVIAISYGKFLKSVGVDYQNALAKAGEVASEVLGNMRTVRSFGKEEKETLRYGSAVNESFAHGRKRAMAYGLFAGLIGLLSYTAIVFVLWYGGTLVISGEMQPGALVSFLLYTIFIASAFGGLAGVFTQLMTAVGSSQRLFDLLDLQPTINTHKGTGGALPSDASKARVVFENIKFSYPSRKDISVLTDVSFTCEPGKVVALCGQSGSGKSTIISLMERFYDPDEGTIKCWGQNLKTIDHGFLHSKIALVSQEPVLFATTIRENILYGITRKVTDEEIEAASRQACAHEFVTNFPEGYMTLVGERGVQLSGGQKQRVAIARAILMDPVLLLLDEATSALDAESEGLVQDALEKLMVQRTTIVIAHRLSTIRNADTIMVMDHGKIVEKASRNEAGLSAHQQLLERTDGYYFTLIKKQLDGELPKKSA